MFRPDVYGATWSYYPDSLSFHAHQAVDLYDDANAYFDADGNPIGSWRDGDTVTVTMEEENHYELALGTDSRSFDQWDVWNAVFSPQGYNGYPLDPWDKVDGTIDHDTTALWADQLDFTEYLRTNWGGTRDLGAALKNRVHVSVGTLDNYYLNGGVEQFKKTLDELGGSDWADIDIVPGGNHGGFYDYKSLNDQLDRMWDWFETHSPDGAEPLTAADTALSTEGNLFSDILKWGGRQAAVDRQATPQVDLASATVGDTVTADFGAWDPGMALVGQWTRDGQPVGDPIDLGVATLADVSTSRATHVATADEAGKVLAFTVTETKRGYETETRTTPVVAVSAAASPTPTPAPTPSATSSETPTPAVTPSPSASATPGAAGSGQSLAHTGAPEAPIAAVVGAAVAVLVGGGLILLVRRRARQRA